MKDAPSAPSAPSALRQSMPVVTRLEDGTILSTEDDHERAAAAAEVAGTAATAEPEVIPTTPAESGAGEEIEDHAS